MDEIDVGGIGTMEMNDKFSESEMLMVKNSILVSVAKSDGFFKNQQIGEKDLTFEEKRDIAENLLDKNVPLFLQRYWKFVKLEDISFFNSYSENYEVKFFINEIMKMKNSKSYKVRVRNRRYEALKQMVSEGSYFSDKEMRGRNPFLYDEMIGKHLTEQERVAAYKKDHPDEKFSAFLMDQMERNVENCLYELQKNEDEAVVEESDDQESSEEESELEDESPAPAAVTEEEKQMFRTEFTNIMYESFLAGNDQDFDYHAVDDNADYDSVQQREFDEQEKYFDDESSHSIHESD